MQRRKEKKNSKNEKLVRRVFWWHTKRQELKAWKVLKARISSKRLFNVEIETHQRGSIQKGTQNKTFENGHNK